MIKVGRNDQCHCGSGKKYKKCCLRNDDQSASVELKLVNERNSYENHVQLDRMLSKSGLDLDDQEAVTPEFEAIEQWIYEYSNQLDANHPFQEYLNDNEITHHSLIELAKKHGLSDFYQKAEYLYSKWQEAFFKGLCK